MTYLPAPIDEPELLPSSERTIWGAIVKCAENILKTKGVRIYLYPSEATQLLNLALPPLKGWRLVEILCALTVLDRSEEIRGAEVRGIAGKVGPIEYQSSRGVRFLWTQPNMTEGRSGLTGRPDIIITDTPEKPSHQNAARIIECKGVRKLGAQTIRAEFAKSYDLRVESYSMWSYYGVSKKVIEGARFWESMSVSLTWGQGLAKPAAIQKRYDSMSRTSLNARTTNSSSPATSDRLLKKSKKSSVAPLVCQANRYNARFTGRGQRQAIGINRERDCDRMSPHGIFRTAGYAKKRRRLDLVTATNAFRRSSSSSLPRAR